MKTLTLYIEKLAKGCERTTLFILIAAAISLVGIGDVHARVGVGGGVGVGARGVGAAPGVGVGARGVGVAPGVGVGAPGVGVLPRGYYAAVPAGYRTVAYRGYTCRYVGGIYYRAAMYQGNTVWVVVQ